MDTNGAYCRMVISAILIGICHILIGATLMAIFMFCLDDNFKDVHVPLYVFGFHFFSVEAILFLNYANGLATPMRRKHRLCAHITFQICALTCIIVGTVMVVIQKGMSGTAHGLTGIIAVTLAGCSLLSSPFVLYGKGYIKLIHFIMGMPTFVASSISLCLAFVKPEFKTWAGPTIVYVLIGFVSFYTAIIIFKVLFKCLSRI